MRPPPSSGCRHPADAAAHAPSSSSLTVIRTHLLRLFRRESSTERVAMRCSNTAPSTRPSASSVVTKIRPFSRYATNFAAAMSYASRHSPVSFWARHVDGVNTCADHTDEHGYARRRNFLSANPKVSRIWFSKTLIRVNPSHPRKSVHVFIRGGSLQLSLISTIPAV